MRQLLLAVNFLHTQNIVHRDLKPANILCTDFSDSAQNRDDEIHIKVTDFGYATKIEPSSKLRSRCGTLMYMAPEQQKF